MSVPDDVRERLRIKLWELADERKWIRLSVAEKSAAYDAWTRDPAVGGVLSRFIRLSDVRLYLKDTLLKSYVRDRNADDALIVRVLRVEGIAVTKTYIKPHGRLLDDGRVYSWGRATAWKLILMATFERAFNAPDGRAFAAVLTAAFGNYHQPNVRKLVETAASKLAIDRVVWIEQ